MKKSFCIISLILLLGNMQAQNNKLKSIKKTNVNKTKTKKMDLKEIITASGLKVNITFKGNGKKVEKGNKVTAHYIGTLADGTFFDSSSRENNAPISFKVGMGQVIPGWDEAFQLLNVGDKALLTIPPSLAYGSKGAGGVIPPNATLKFEVEVMDAIEGPKPKPAVPFEVKDLDTVRMQSGLRFIKIESGSGVKAQQGKYVSVHYTGYLLDGKKFDSSVERGEPLEFQLGRGMVIKGWEEGIELMHVGDKMRFIIPSELAYGETGAPGAIPPNATLIFDCELVDVQ
jgi:peptidylprolyl isomerase